MRKVSEENGITEMGKKIKDFLEENDLDAVVVFLEKDVETGDDETTYSVLCSIQNLGDEYLEGFVVGLEKAESILISNLSDNAKKTHYVGDMLQELFNKHIEDKYPDVIREECKEEKEDDEPKIILFDPDRRRD